MIALRPKQGGHAIIENLFNPWESAVSTPLNRRLVLQAAAATLMPASWQVWAQDAYPGKPVKVVVAFPAGGVADASVRILAESLSPLLNQSVVVDNKPGAIAAIAMQAATSAPADGYTLININNSMLAAQAALKRYDITRQLTPVCLMGHTDAALFASNNAPFSSTQEMVTWARANPDKLNYGSTGPGTLEHLFMSSLAKKYGFTATHIPFKGGPDAMTALAQNEIHVSAMPIPLALQFGQRVKPLATLVDKRNPLLPNTATLKEQGLDFPVMRYWGGLAAPAGTPKAALDVLQKHVAAVIASPGFVAKNMALGLVPVFANAEDFGRLIADDLKFLTTAVADADLRMN